MLTTPRPLPEATFLPPSRSDKFQRLLRTTNFAAPPNPRALNMRYTTASVREEIEFCHVLPTGSLRIVVRTCDWVQAQVVLGMTIFHCIPTPFQNGQMKSSARANPPLSFDRSLSGWSLPLSSRSQRAARSRETCCTPG